MKVTKEWLLKNTDEILTKGEKVNVRKVIESLEQKEFKTSLSGAGLGLAQSGRLNIVTDKFEVYVDGLGWCDCKV